MRLLQLLEAKNPPPSEFERFWFDHKDNEFILLSEKGYKYHFQYVNDNIDHEETIDYPNEESPEDADAIGNLVYSIGMEREEMIRGTYNGYKGFIMLQGVGPGLKSCLQFLKKNGWFKGIDSLTLEMYEDGGMNSYNGIELQRFLRSV
jgi:hypothetical protein